MIYSPTNFLRASWVKTADPNGHQYSSAVIYLMTTLMDYLSVKQYVPVWKLPFNGLIKSQSNQRETPV